MFFKKQKEETQKKLQQIQSTQSFSPIREVQEGIICTKDGRFVKLMEFSPINFNLRSASEQSAIISQFAGALRGMPKTLQFKVVSRKSDVTEYSLPSSSIRTDGFDSPGWTRTWYFSAIFSFL